MTDIFSGWTVAHVVERKEGHLVANALKEMEGEFLFSIVAVYSDNGTEFLNEDVIEFLHGPVREVMIAFFRSRPYKKNDQAHVEQKTNALTLKKKSKDGYRRQKWDLILLPFRVNLKSRPHCSGDTFESTPGGSSKERRMDNKLPTQSNTFIRCSTMSALPQLSAREPSRCKGQPHGCMALD